jgi:hypothetical protein
MLHAEFSVHRGIARSWLVLFAIVLSIVIAGWIASVYVQRFTHDLRQRAQLSVAVSDAIELFKNEHGLYPPSDANDPARSPYCGAMKLAEAMLGQDRRGFHPGSAFRADGLDPNGAVLYPVKPNETNLRGRRGPYLSADSARAFPLADVYGRGKTGPFREGIVVLCDTYVHKRPSGKKTGMPILHYRANPSGTAHDPNSPNNIYDYRDNQMLLRLGVPGDPNVVHPLAEPRRFYLNTQDVRVPTRTPVRRNCFILISAGRDGLYGTADDICNFEWRYRKGGAQK